MVISDDVLDWLKKQIQHVRSNIPENKDALVQELRENKIAEITTRVCLVAIPIGLAMYPFQLSIVLKQTRGTLNNPTVGFFLTGAGRSIWSSIIKAGLATQNESIIHLAQDIQKTFTNIPIKNEYNAWCQNINKFFLISMLAGLETILTQPNSVKKLYAILEKINPNSIPPSYWKLLSTGLYARWLRNSILTAGLIIDPVSEIFPGFPSAAGFIINALIAAPFSTCLDSMARIQATAVTTKNESGTRIKVPTLMQIIKTTPPSLLLTGTGRTMLATLIAYSIYFNLNEVMDKCMKQKPQLRKDTVEPSPNSIHPIFNFFSNTLVAPPKEVKTIEVTTSANKGSLIPQFMHPQYSIR